MADRPILFSGPMVRALLEGRKTQMRRVVKQLAKGYPVVNLRQYDPDRFSGRVNDASSWGYAYAEDGDHMPLDCWMNLCPYGQAGDLLWVRETWMDLLGTGIEHRPTPDSARQWYAYGAESPAGSASDEARKDFGLKWKPSIHMPRVASRLTLRITDVRVERLNECSHADAVAEGVGDLIEYSVLWEQINGPGSWSANPWVWALTFEAIPRNIDAVLLELANAPEPPA